MISEVTAQLAQFQQHREESTVPEVAKFTSNSRGELETLKKFRVTNFANSQAKRREAVQNHQLLVQSRIEFTKQAKRVKIQSHIKGETGRSLERTQSPAQDRDTNSDGSQRRDEMPNKTTSTLIEVDLNHRADQQVADENFVCKKMPGSIHVPIHQGDCAEK